MEICEHLAKKRLLVNTLLNTLLSVISLVGSVLSSFHLLSPTLFTSFLKSHIWRHIDFLLSFYTFTSNVHSNQHGFVFQNLLEASLADVVPNP